MRNTHHRPRPTAALAVIGLVLAATPLASALDPLGLAEFDANGEWVCSQNGDYYTCCYYDEEGTLYECRNWVRHCEGWWWWQECYWEEV